MEYLFPKQQQTVGTEEKEKNEKEKKKKVAKGKKSFKNANFQNTASTQSLFQSVKKSLITPLIILRNV